ncbi:carbohydrate kinase family protein [Oceaniglobus roseus]|uniref:carbohydrate kinase family protein n=1 Tax=Oceaniglobus roseus TaxID=1737570 RepID=UPI000C7EF423|nr:carbohydrate kinase family protein [Kandeliimicrobium roseum]
MSGPDLLLLGQVTIDHVVPAVPAPWEAKMGGNAIYSAAGARLWLDPARIGVTLRIGTGFPFDVEAMLRGAGIGHVHCRAVDLPHITEWIVYETDGSRRCLPKNAGLTHIGSEGDPGDTDTYLDYLLTFSPEAADVPAAWLPAKAAHLNNQVRDRTPQSLAALRGKAGYISVDPSPFVARGLDAPGLAAALPGADAVMPSEMESAHIAAGDWRGAARALASAGFAEAIIKRGAQSVILAHGGGTSEVPVPPVEVVDVTGAGDSFGGAYCACRMLGLDPVEAARRAIVAAGMVIGCSGADAALALDPDEAGRRLQGMS